MVGGRFPEERRKQRPALEALALLDARDRRFPLVERLAAHFSCVQRTQTLHGALAMPERDLVRRADQRLAHLRLAALGDRVEAPQAVDLIAKELDPQR